MLKMEQVVVLCAVLIAGVTCLVSGRAHAEDEWIVYDGFDGPGNGKHIVL